MRFAAYVADIRVLILIVKPKERGPLGVGGKRILHKKGVGLESCAQNMDCRRAVVNMVMNLLE